MRTEKNQSIHRNYRDQLGPLFFCLINNCYVFNQFIPALQEFRMQPLIKCASVFTLRISLSRRIHGPKGLLLYCNPLTHLRSKKGKNMRYHMVLWRVKT